MKVLLILIPCRQVLLEAVLFQPPPKRGCPKLALGSFPRASRSIGIFGSKPVLSLTNRPTDRRSLPWAWRRELIAERSNLKDFTQNRPTGSEVSESLRSVVNFVFFSVKFCVSVAVTLFFNRIVQFWPFAYPELRLMGWCAKTQYLRTNTWLCVGFLLTIIRSKPQE